MFSQPQTHYIENISHILSETPIIKDKYKKDVGFLGDKLLQTPYISDETKLDIISRKYPKYKENINTLKKVLPKIQKLETIRENLLIPKNENAKEQYNLYSSNQGGKTRRKRTTKRRTRTKKRKSAHK
jgi:hypothetical protein